MTTLPGARPSTLHAAARAIALVAFFLVTMSATADDAPRAEITNGLVTARFYLPDAERGHYRGTRFDRSGDTYSLRFAGHE
ncbi:MAG: hypothetical protein ACHP85_22200, partial [Burkholderiales bacterium]